MDNRNWKRLVLWQIVTVIFSVVTFFVARGLGASEQGVAITIDVAALIAFVSVIATTATIMATAIAALIAIVAVIATTAATMATVDIGAAIIVILFTVFAFATLAVDMRLRYLWVLASALIEAAAIFAASTRGDTLGIGLAAAGVLCLLALARFGENRATLPLPTNALLHGRSG